MVQKASAGVARHLL